MTNMKKFVAYMAAVFGLTTTAWAANVAQIGEQGYETLEAAIAAAKNGDKVQLVNDVTLSAALRIDNKALDVDLGGHTITGQFGFKLGQNGAYTASMKNGTVQRNGWGPVYVWEEKSGTTKCTVLLENLAINYTGTTVFTDPTDGSVYMGANDGLLEVTFRNVSVNDRICVCGLAGKATAIVESVDSTYEAREPFYSSATLKVRGGTYAQDVTSFVDTGYECVQLENGKYVVQEKVLAKLEDLTTDASCAYLIATVEDLITFRDLVNQGTNFDKKVVKQTANLDLSAVDNFVSIGSQGKGKSFKGTYDGQGYTISNLKCVSAVSGVGMFGKADGTIRNVTVVNGSVRGTDVLYVGGIVGHGYATIENCRFEGTVVGGQQVGGISGSFCGKEIKNCNFIGSVTGLTAVGGIAGRLQEGADVISSYVSGSVAASVSTQMDHVYAGGLVGDVVNQTSSYVTKNFVDATIKVNGEDVATPVIGVYYNPITESDLSSEAVLSLQSNGWNTEKSTASALDIVSISDGADASIKAPVVLNNAVVVQQDASGAYTVSLAVAQIGETKYETINDAIKAVNSQPGDDVTIKILCDIKEKLGDDYELFKNVNLVTDVEGGVTVDFDHVSTDDDSSIETVGKTLTIAEGVNIVRIYQLFNGYYANRTDTTDIYGDAELCQLWAANDSIVNIYPTAHVVMGCCEGMVKLRWSGTLNVTGSANDSQNKQLSGGYIWTDYPGVKTVNLKDTYVSTAWLTVDDEPGNQGGGSLNLSLDNATLETAHESNNGVSYGAAGGTISMKNGSLIIAGAIQNVTTITIDGASYGAEAVKVIDYTGAGTMTLADYATTVTVTGDMKAEVRDNDLWIVPKVYVAQIGEGETIQKFETLQAAVDAAANGALIQILSETAVADLAVSGKAVIIEHNNKITDVDPIKGTSIAPAVDAECVTKLGTWTNAIVVGDLKSCVALTANTTLNNGPIKEKYSFGGYLSFFVGKSVTLDANLLLPAYNKTAAGVYFCGKDGEANGLTLDLNGHEIRQTFADNGNGFTGHAAVNVNSGYLTIKDSATGGKIVGSTNGLNVWDYSSREEVDPSYVVLKSGTIISQGGNSGQNGGGTVNVYDNATFVMDDGVIEIVPENANSWSLTQVYTGVALDQDSDGGNFIMNGGEIKAFPEGYFAYYPIWTTGPLEINGGTIHGANSDFVIVADGPVKITDGTVEGVMYFDLEDQTAISGGVFTDPWAYNYVTVGNRLVNNGDGTYTVVEAVNVIASITYSVEEDIMIESFTDLEIAVNYAEDGDTIDIEKDTTTAVTIPVGVTIRLNGKTTGTLSAPVGYIVVDGAEAGTKTVARPEIVINMDDDVSAPIKVSEEWIAENVGENATVAQITEKLETVEANGLKGWQNYVMGVNGTLTTNVLEPMEGVATAAEKAGKTEPIVITAPLTIANAPAAADSKIAVSYQLFKGTMVDGTISWGATPEATATTPRFALDFKDTTGDTYWKIAVVFTSVK